MATPVLACRGKRPADGASDKCKDAKGDTITQASLGSNRQGDPEDLGKHADLKDRQVQTPAAAHPESAPAIAKKLLSHAALPSVVANHNTNAALPLASSQ